MFQFCGILVFVEKPKGARNWRHGHAGTKLYQVWGSIVGRCENPNDQSYHRYGGRGITICDRWRDSFENFLADMGQRPSDGHSIDRIDNDGPYSPENCRWATRTEQNNNSSNVHWIEQNGVRDTIQGWAARLGCEASVISSRLSKGWSESDAVTIPADKNNSKRSTPRYSYDGKSLTIPGWAKETGIPRNVIGYRLKSGWSIELALTSPIDQGKKRVA